MKITVDRTITEDRKLVFTITCSDPQHAPFTEKEKDALEFLDRAKESIDLIGNPESPINGQIAGALHHIKQKTFDRVRNQMVHAIQKDIETRIRHICQEVYNWTYDEQPAYLLKWMHQFDPQRTKYYFSNDKTIEDDEEDEN